MIEPESNWEGPAALLYRLLSPFERGFLAARSPEAFTFVVESNERELRREIADALLGQYLLDEALRGNTIH